MRGGVVWSHLLASILGGLVVAGVLLAFGEIGRQRTETVPINYSSSAPPAGLTGAGSGSDAASIYDDEGSGVVLIKTKIARSTSSPFISGTEMAGTTATGSGFLISRRGFILTTYHEIEGADMAHPAITVQFNAQTRRPAEVIRQNVPDDVALLKVDMRGVSDSIQTLPLGQSRLVSAGASVLSMGNPSGLDRTLSSGIVSSLQRRLVGVGGAEVTDVLQSDIPPTPGSDGGPLMDSGGNVIGIDSQIRVTSGGADYTVGFAVPIDTARVDVLAGVLP